MIAKDQIRALRNHGDEGPLVSIYIPTEVVGDYDKNRITFKNALKEASQKLQLRSKNAIEILTEANQLIDNESFWQNQGNGLAVFISSSQFVTIALSNKVPVLTHVGASFVTAPLLQERHTKKVFILSLSQKKTDFYEAVEDGIYPILIHDKLPLNMEAALRIDEENDNLQTHVAGGQPIYHSHKDTNLVSQERIKQYCRQVDNALMEVIHDETAPLVISAVDRIYSMYRDITRYKNFSRHLCAGNPESMNPQDLRSCVEPLFYEMRQDALEEFTARYSSLKQVDGMTGEGIEDIISNSVMNNIDSIILSQDWFFNLDESKLDNVDNSIVDAYLNGSEIIITKDEDLSIRSIHRFSITVEV